MLEYQFSELQIFLFSIVVGFILDFAYEVILSTLNFLQSKIWMCYIRDILFFSIAGIFTFMFLLVVNFGEFRFFVFIGEFFGCMLCHFTIGKLFNLVFQTIKGKVVSLIYSIKRRIFKKT